MAIKVIKTEPDGSVVREAICRKCGVTLSYLPLDCAQQNYTDMSGCADTSWSITCPQCQNRIEVRDPYLSRQ